MIYQFAEHERSSTKPAQLLLQTLTRQRLFFCPGERHGRVKLCGMAEFIPGDDGKRAAQNPVRLNSNRALNFRLIAAKTLPQSAVQFRVAGLPDLVADMNARKVD